MSAAPGKPLFDHVALIGLGLIGSSLAHAHAPRQGLAGTISGLPRARRRAPRRAGSASSTGCMRRQPRQSGEPIW